MVRPQQPRANYIYMPGKSPIYLAKNGPLLARAWSHYWPAWPDELNARRAKSPSVPRLSRVSHIESRWPPLRSLFAHGGMGSHSVDKGATADAKPATPTRRRPQQPLPTLSASQRGMIAASLATFLAIFKLLLSDKESPTLLLSLPLGTQVDCFILLVIGTTLNAQLVILPPNHDNERPLGLIAFRLLHSAGLTGGALRMATLHSNPTTPEETAVLAMATMILVSTAPVHWLTFVQGHTLWWHARAFPACATISKAVPAVALFLWTRGQAASYPPAPLAGQAVPNLGSSLAVCALELSLVALFSPSGRTVLYSVWCVALGRSTANEVRLSERIEQIGAEKERLTYELEIEKKQRERRSCSPSRSSRPRAGWELRSSVRSHSVAGDSGSSVSLTSEDWAALQAADAAAAARHSRPISLNNDYTCS